MLRKVSKRLEEEQRTFSKSATRGPDSVMKLMKAVDHFGRMKHRVENFGRWVGNCRLMDNFEL